jgi:Tfp pilus assembly protein PilF
MKGREHYLRFTKEELAKAEACFKRAIELDPNFGQAQAALALLYFEGSNNQMEEAFKINYEVARLRARQHLREAMKKPTASVYQLAGVMDLNLRQWDAAISQLEAAVASDPSDPACHDAMSWVLSMSGRPAEGMEYAKRGMRLDPLNPARYLGRIGIAHFCMGEWKEAATAIEKAMKLNPELWPPLAFLASAYAHLGRNEEAKAAYQAYNQWMSRYTWGRSREMYKWPFRDRRVEDSFAEGFIKAGFPSSWLVSIHVSKEDQLTGDDLRALLFPSTLTGFVPQDWSWETTKDGIATLRASWVTGGVDTGRVWLEGDKWWSQFQNYFYGMAYCSTVFKNPKGTAETKDAYIRFGDLYYSKFSRVR